VKTTTSTEVKRMNVNIPLDLHNKFKSIAAARGERMTDLVLQFVQQYVGMHETQKKGRR
jgi:hypothetical protein